MERSKWSYSDPTRSGYDDPYPPRERTYTLMVDERVIGDRRYTVEMRPDDRTGAKLDYAVIDGDEVVAMFRFRDLAEDLAQRLNAGAAR